MGKTDRTGDLGSHDTLRALASRGSKVMASPLTPAQKRYLRGLAHPLKPVILVGGKGVTPGLVAELDLALEHHELLKVKVAAEDREARDQWIGELVGATAAALVARVGHTAVLYRRSREKPLISLPRG
jgi:RNA-binding protein